jgi:hypothetical protein
MFFDTDSVTVQQAYYKPGFFFCELVAGLVQVVH